MVDEWTEVFGSERLTGVQLIHVDADGLPALDKPGPDGLPKRSFGQMAGAVCVLGLQGHGGVNVAEGLADALALAARLPWRAVCMGGTARFHRLELARWLAGSGTVHINEGNVSQHTLDRLAVFTENAFGARRNWSSIARYGERARGR